MICYATREGVKRSPSLSYRGREKNRRRHGRGNRLTPERQMIINHLVRKRRRQVKIVDAQGERGRHRGDTTALRRA